MTTRILSMIGFIFLINQTYAQTITSVSNPTPGTVCEGGIISITFNANGFPNIAGDEFQFLLSGSSGTFPLNPTIIGTIPTVNGNNIAMTGAIPGVLTGATTYKVKIRGVILNGAGAADNDTIFSAEKNLSIKDDPIATISPSTSLSLCLGATQQLIGSITGGTGAAATYTYYWSVPASGGVISPNPAQTTTYTAPLAGAGTYTITVTATNGTTLGCNASITKDIIITDVPTVNAGGAIPAICQGGTTIALGGSFGGGATSAVWSASPATGTFANNGGSTPGTTTYTASAGSTSPITLTLTTSGGSCGSATASKIVTVNQNPTVNAGGAIPAICQGGTTIALGGSFGGGATSAVWSASPATGTFANNGGSTPGTTTYTASAGSTSPITLTLTTSGGSCGSVTASKTVIVNPTPTVNSSPNTQTHCSGDLITAIVITNPNNVSGTTFSWTRTNTTNITGLPSSGTSNPITGTLINNTNSPQTTTFTITATAGACSTSTTVSVNINPTPTVSATPLTQTKCSGVPITNIVITNPNSVSGTTFSWTRTNTTNLTGITASGTSSTISGTLTNTTTTQQTSTFTIIATANNCPSVSFTVTVIINPLPDFSVSPSQGEICVGQASTNFIVTTISGTSTYTWSPSLGLNQTTGVNIIASPTVNTTYVVTGNTSNGCTKNAQVTVAILPVPVISVSSISTSICSNDTTSLFVTSTGTPVANYNWQPSGLLNSSTGTNVIASVTNSTASPTTQLFSVIGTTTFGCTATDNVTITINPLPNPPTINGKDPICAGEANVIYTIAPPVQATDIFSWSATPAGINAFISNGNHDTCLADFSGLSGGITSCTLFTSVTTAAFGCKSFGQKIISIGGQSPPLETVIKFSNNPFTLAVLYSQSGTNYRWGRDSISNFDEDTIGFNNEFGNQNLQLFLVPDTNATPLHFDQFYYWVEYYNSGINCKQKAYFNIDSTNLFQSLTAIQNKIVDSKNYFIVYPNPTDGIFILQFDASVNNQKDQLFIYDLSGKEMENHKSDFNSNRIEINEDRKYPPGIYFVKYINSEGGCQISKIIIQ